MTIHPPNQLPPNPEGYDAQAASLATLYTTYSPALLRTLVRLVGDREWAEDLLHDTFLKIAAHLDDYKPDQGEFYSWLVTIARRVALDELRKRKVRAEAASYIRERSSEYTDSAVNQQLSAEQLYRFLPTKQSQVLILLYTQGLTMGEIAQALDLPLGTVKTRCRLGLQTLRAVFRRDIYQYKLV